MPVLVACFAVEAQEAVELEAQQITAPREVERGNGPVDGYVARRSVSATKTDTPIIETPQSISVITRDRIRDQGSLTIQDALRYVSGMRGEAYGFDSRGDSSLVRGVTPTTFLDGLQQSVGSYNNTRTDPFTLERIEVIKGPSSMLYGQSSVGGLLNLVSIWSASVRRPSRRTSCSCSMAPSTASRSPSTAPGRSTTMAPGSTAWWRSSATARPRSTTPRTTDSCSCPR